MREFSRTAKNRILGAVAGLYFLLLVYRSQVLPQNFDPADKVWMVGAILVALVYLKPLVDRIPHIYRHAALFLLVGSAVGFTLGDALQGPKDLFWGFWIWLAVAIVGAVIHYSPSRRDIYR